MKSLPEGRLLLYATPPHECSYLHDSEAVTVFADPDHPKSPWLYSALARQGFRRSGTHLYRPQCPSCEACQSVRVAVGRFQPDRSQRRTIRRNADLQVRVLNQAFQQEHYDLYARYVVQRHPGGGMDDPTPAKYRDFLLAHWCDTWLVEFRLEQRLLAVSVCDRLPDGLSAVYTFFDCDHAERSLGSNAILWQVDAARREGLDWVYLGYWIESCQKMSYKARYAPQERYRAGAWHGTR